jgi:hypothetical protein
MGRRRIADQNRSSTAQLIAPRQMWSASGSSFAEAAPIMRAPAPLPAAAPMGAYGGAVYPPWPTLAGGNRMGTHRSMVQLQNASFDHLALALKHRVLQPRQIRAVWASGG